VRTVFALLLLPAAVCSPAFSEAETDAYRVVWDTPSRDSAGSMPLGNGDLGINVWVEDNGDLLFYLSKTDAWSGQARLLKLGRVRVSLQPPLPTAASFRQVLDVRTGSVEIAAGDVTMRVWVDAHYPAVRVEARGAAPFTMSASLECWRTAPRELDLEERDSAYGLMESPAPIVEHPDTILEDQPNRVMWFHRNEESIWSDTLRLQGMEGWLAQGKDPLLHRTFGGLMRGVGLVSQGNTILQSAQPSTRQTCTIYALTAQTDSPGDWVKSLEQLASVDASEPESQFQRHCAWWDAFWSRSWIHVSGEDTAHINQGYVLQRFITACAGRGGSPIKFNGSIFTVDAVKKDKRFDADYRQWGGPYWFQNTRLIYWPMLAAGDTEMMEPLFRMYLDALPFAVARTKTYFGHEGAFFPETMYFWGAYANDNYGWNREGKTLGITDNAYIRYYYDGALELLALMLDRFRYTGDRAFLETTLLPLAGPVLTFYHQHYPLDGQGKLRIYPSQALETWQKAANPLPPVAGLRCVLEGLLDLPVEVTSSAQRDDWSALLAILPGLPMMPEGDKPVLAAAQEILEEARNSENPELYAVFPYRLYGVGKPDLEMARRTFERRRVKGNEGWRQDDTQAALLGLTEEAKERLSKRLATKHEGSRFPAFWGPNFDWIPDQDHGGSAMMALQSMLVQTNGRQILLFPAWPKGWNVDFKLHAPFNTVLEGAWREGKIERLEVTPSERMADVVRMDPR
jgi:hypothetical protein